MAMRASINNTWVMTPEGHRMDWSEIRDRIDLGIVATVLLGPAPGRRGEKGRRSWWLCPFHPDKNPSFCVTPGKGNWRCWGCGEHGDAATLVMKLNGVSFPKARAWLAGQCGAVTASISTRSRAPSEGMPGYPRPPFAPSSTARSMEPRRRPAGSANEQSPGLPPADALELVENAAIRLWTPGGAKSLAYLRGRGLTESTIRSARLGWTPQALGVPWKPPGVVIPWFDAGRLTLIKIRPPDEWRARYPKRQGPPKYIEAYRDRPTLYPGPSIVQIGQPLVVSEGELDCLLLGQALGELAAVVTLGSASARPEGTTFLSMLPAPAWFVATDSDEAGDKAALGWPARARRVRPPAPFKDWTEAHQAGMDLRGWWTDHLAEIEAPPPRTWEELSVARWGPALTDQTPGIVINGIARVWMPVAVDVSSAIEAFE
jgi:CHC2 zinc finger